MPTALILLTPQFSFEMLSLPPTLPEFQMKYYKSACYSCGQVQNIASALCLLCGITLCYGPAKCVPAIEGMLSSHSRLHEGGQCVFINLQEATIILIGNNGSSAKFESPYRTKYGEMYTGYNKNTHEYLLDEEGGGLAQLRSLQQSYKNFELCNRVLAQRTNPDSKF